MEEITLESLMSLNQEELAQLAFQKHQDLIKEETLRKNTEKWAVAAATELNALKKAKKEEPEPVDVDALLETKLQQREVGNKLTWIVSQLPADLQEKFNTQYEELVWGRTLSPAEADKMIKAALALIAPDAKENNIAALWIWWWQPWKGNSIKAQEKEDREQYAKNFLKGII